MTGKYFDANQRNEISHDSRGRERNRLEFDVYDYAMKRFGAPEAPAKEK